MTAFSLKGLGVALITPFKADFSIDFDALGKLIDRIIDGGADYIVVLGTTAETPTMSLSERIEVIRFVRSRNNGRLPLVVGMGGNNTAELIELINNINLDGYQAILSAVPYYNKPTQEGIYQHFKAIASASPLPIVLYNIPSRTGVNMEVDTTLRLAREIPNIIGIKEASGNIGQITRIIAGRPEDFKVISGDDSLTVPLMSIGADGVISVIANAMTKEFKCAVESAQAGDFAEASKWHILLSELIRQLFVDGNPAGVKSLLNLMGCIENVLRLPLVTASLATAEKIKKEYQRVLNCEGSVK